MLSLLSRFCTLITRRYNPADANTGAVAYTSIAPYAYATYGNSILTLGADELQHQRRY